MTPAEVKKAIEQKNRQTAADRGKQFVKRSSDQQMLDHLTKAARVAIDDYFSNGRDCAAAMKELRSALVIAERRAR